MINPKNAMNAKEIAQNIIDLEMELIYFKDGSVEKINDNGQDIMPLIEKLIGFDNLLDVCYNLKKYPIQESNEDRGDILQEIRKEEKHYGC